MLRVTAVPLLGTRSTKPWNSSSCRASRTTFCPTCICPLRRLSVIRSPGDRLPFRIASRIAFKTGSFKLIGSIASKLSFALTSLYHRYAIIDDR